MISGAAQADVCSLMVPADGNFTTAIQKGNHKAGEVQGQTRQHARLINLLGVKQLMVGVNKMDTDTAGPYRRALRRCDSASPSASPLCPLALSPSLPRSLPTPDLPSLTPDPHPTGRRRDAQHAYQVGWKKDFIGKPADGEGGGVPVLPISGWMGDNLIKKTTNMSWWQGVDVIGEDKTKFHIDKMLDALNDMFRPPGRNETAPMRMPVSGVY